MRTRLYERMGVTVASTAEEAVCSEALNAAMNYHAASLPPQMRQIYSGYTLANLSTTVSAHTANTANVTLTNATSVYPGDILTDTVNTRSYIIRTVAGSVLNLGIPITGSINGNAVTVARRSIPLPTAGAVMEVYEKDGWRSLTFNPLISVKAQFDTGQASHWTQGFSETGGTSYLSLFPAPSASTQYVIAQFPAYDEDSDIYASEGLLSAILSTAHEYRMSMAAGLGGVARMATHQEMLRSKTSGGHGVMARP